MLRVPLLEPIGAVPFVPVVAGFGWSVSEVPRFRWFVATPSSRSRLRS